ncbi:MAG: type ISP restriction/modification enzyme [Bacteroidia bacterium]
MTIAQYIENINKRYQLGNATEHTFRGDLQQLLESLVPDIRATNEPKRQSCGAPDYILTKKDASTGSAGIPVGFIEAKDIGDNDLEGAKKTGNKEQFDRYKASLNNLIFTDYLSFHLYIEGVFIIKISIAEITDKGIKPLTENFGAFENLIKDFCVHIGQTIKSSKKLAEMMAGKARLLADVIEKALTSDEVNQENSTLKDQMVAFKQILIHDITPKGFADVYAQTIAYGMFAARLHDPTLPTFSRQEAAELIPKSNPFLRKLFSYIAGPDIDDRIKWIVDSLVEIFLACNVEEILKNYGKQTKMEDPIIHFYETFLSEYDPKLRKARGVWYTPHPVVSFQVRAIDEILKTEFDLPQGIADNSKIKIKVNVQGKQVEQEVHRVQILDPATGTGTYLAEVIKHIHKKFEGQQGIWSNYVENHLLPRLIGFELLMASYAMAHLQIDLLLTETGFKPSVTSSGAEKNQRLKVYLTNSLEESHPDTGTLFANWLSSEANEANFVKRDAPVMVIMGNPPYAVSSTNKGEWIEKLTVDYKKNLNERNIQPLSDDYIKFIRFGQHFIDKNGSGVLAYISNNSFIDGIIHRQMRKHLLESFDKIYILDLHGNAKKKEVCPDGSVDQNVFDIMQGVSINIFVKTGKKSKSELGKLLHFDLQGKREFKYDFLKEGSLKNVNWNELKPLQPNLFFVNKDFSHSKLFVSFIDLRKLFILNSMGIATGNDDDLVSFDKSEIQNKYGNSKPFYYRPFDVRHTIFDNTILQRARFKLMSNYSKNNLGLNIVRQSKQKGIETLITNNITNRDFITNHTYNFPLYLYPEINAQQTLDSKIERTPNLDLKTVKQIEKKLGLTFVNEPFDYAQGDIRDTFAPIDILDYIYAVLHSPTYREKYKEFLKIDFPRVPYPKDVKTFWQLVKFGGEIRQIHLLESAVVENYITQYPVDGSNIVDKIKFVSNKVPIEKVEKKYYSTSDDVDTNQDNRDDISFPQPHLKGNEDMLLHEPSFEETASFLAVTGKVFINETQYFNNVPEVAWNFYIGGYQPAQKWLKDRKGRKLEFEDILHYQKIIVALTETDRFMKEIESIEIE